MDNVGHCTREHSANHWNEVNPDGTCHPTNGTYGDESGGLLNGAYAGNKLFGSLYGQFLHLVVNEVAQRTGIAKTDLESRCYSHSSDKLFTFLRERYYTLELKTTASFTVRNEAAFSGRQNKLGYGGNIGYIFQTDTGVPFATYHMLPVVSAPYLVETIIYPRGKLLQIYRYLRDLPRHRGTLTPPIMYKDDFDKLVRHTLGFLTMNRHQRKILGTNKRGVILAGPPGVGKSMFTRWLWREVALAGRSSAMITGANLAKDFASGNIKLPRCSLLIFDDLDPSLFKRSAGSRTTEASDFLSALDGANEDLNQTPITQVRVFTTNEEVTQLDPAFKRPGRIDFVLSLQQPKADLRLELVKRWPEEIQQEVLKDKEWFEANSNGMSFADLELLRSIMGNDYLENGSCDLQKAMTEFRAGQPVQRRLGL